MEVIEGKSESATQPLPPIGPLDTQIGAHALSLGATLVTSNTKEFQRIKGLRVENWLL